MNERIGEADALHAFLLEHAKAWKEHEAECYIAFWRMYKLAPWDQDPQGFSTGEEKVHSWHQYRKAVCSIIGRSRSHIDNVVKRIDHLDQDGVDEQTIMQAVTQAPMAVDDLYADGHPDVDVPEVVDNILAQPSPEDARAYVGSVLKKTFYRVSEFGEYNAEAVGHPVTITRFDAEGSMKEFHMVFQWQTIDDMDGGVLQWLKSQLRFKPPERD